MESNGAYNNPIGNDNDSFNNDVSSVDYCLNNIINNNNDDNFDFTINDSNNVMENADDIGDTKMPARNDKEGAFDSNYITPPRNDNDNLNNNESSKRQKTGSATIGVNQSMVKGHNPSQSQVSEFFCKRAPLPNNNRKRKDAPNVTNTVTVALPPPVLGSNGVGINNTTNVVGTGNKNIESTVRDIWAVPVDEQIQQPPPIPPIVVSNIEEGTRTILEEKQMITLIKRTSNHHGFSNIWDHEIAMEPQIPKQSQALLADKGKISMIVYSLCLLYFLI
jgi:hypothetical protein